MQTAVDAAVDSLQIAGVNIAPHPSEPGYFVVDGPTLFRMMRRATMRGRYPWGLWMRGRKWRLEQGEDFEPSVTSFRQQLYNRALKEGVTVTTRIDGTAIEFQFSTSEK